MVSTQDNNIGIKRVKRKIEREKDKDREKRNVKTERKIKTE